MEYDGNLSISTFTKFFFTKTINDIQDKRHPTSKMEVAEKAGHIAVHTNNREMGFAITCGILLALGFALSFIHSFPIYISIGLYIGAYFFGGYYTTREAISGISKGHFEIDFLMLVAAIGAAVLGEWAEGALLLFLFSMGHSLEHYAMAKAKKSIEALAKLTPKTALLKVGESLKEVPIERLEIGHIIIVKPNSTIPADGIVIQGNSSVNQAPITGESIPVDKMALPESEIKNNPEKINEEHRVFAGTVNGNGNLDVYVTKIATDTTIARLIRLVNEAQAQKSPTQQFTNKIENIMYPLY